MKGIFNNVTQISMEVIDRVVTEDDTVIDMTMGNGNDMLYLAKRAGKVYGFDIQNDAVTTTCELLEENKVGNTIPILDSHENVLEYVDERVKFVIYNLGYLPGGDKEIVTKINSTLNSLDSVLSILESEGVVLICAYVGHDGGMEEYEGILEYANELSKKDYNVLNLSHVNRRDISPKIIIIEKIR